MKLSEIITPLKDYQNELDTFDRKMAIVFNDQDERWNRSLEAYLTKNLEKLGFEFETRDLFLAFLKNRVTRIVSGEFTKFYLDYNSKACDLGRQIGAYRTNQTTEYLMNGLQMAIITGFVPYEKLIFSKRLVPEQSEQPICIGCGRTYDEHSGSGKDICPNPGGRFVSKL